MPPYWSQTSTPIFKSPTQGSSSLPSTDLHASICYPTRPRPSSHTFQKTYKICYRDRYGGSERLVVCSQRWQQQEESGYIHPVWLAPKPVPFAVHLLSPKEDQWLPPQHQWCTFSSIHFFVSAPLCQPDARHPPSHSGLPELMLSSSLCQRRQESKVLTSMGRKKSLESNFRSFTC